LFDHSIGVMVGATVCEVKESLMHLFRRFPRLHPTRRVSLKRTICEFETRNPRPSIPHHQMWLSILRSQMAEILHLLHLPFVGYKRRTYLLHSASRAQRIAEGRSNTKEPYSSSLLSILVTQPHPQRDDRKLVQISFLLHRVRRDAGLY